MSRPNRGRAGSTEHGGAPTVASKPATGASTLRPSGAYDNVRRSATTIRAGGRELRIGDIATVSRGFVETASAASASAGRTALGLSVAMTKGGDIIALGANLHDTVARVQAQLPVGMELTEVASQPAAVQRSITSSCARWPRR